MAKQWVQHISGQGEKWKVYAEERSGLWIVDPHDLSGGQIHRPYLPKSEYRLCDPPEVWKDVTEECEPSTQATLAVHHKGRVCTHGGIQYPDVYRFRKVQVFNGDGATHSMWAFIVEQQVTA